MCNPGNKHKTFQSSKSMVTHRNNTTHHSSVTAIFVSAPDSVLACVGPVHTVSGRVKI